MYPIPASVGGAIYMNAGIKDLSISDYTVLTIQKAAQAGIYIVLCSGRTENGILPYVRRLEIAGTEARTLLGLKSTNFTFAIDEQSITFTVTGYGHGVGMSQNGANALALSGKNCFEIISHYYTNVEITSVTSMFAVF